MVTAEQIFLAGFVRWAATSRVLFEMPDLDDGLVSSLPFDLAGYPARYITGKRRSDSRHWVLIESDPPVEVLRTPVYTQAGDFDHYEFEWCTEEPKGVVGTRLKLAL
jgi:hypothetical protein